MDQTPIIRLDGSAWRTVDDFYGQLLEVLEAPAWHGANVNALVDSMIWGGLNGLTPPYRIVIHSISNPDIRAEAALCSRAVSEDRIAHRQAKGGDVKVWLELAD